MENIRYKMAIDTKVEEDLTDLEEVTESEFNLGVRNAKKECLDAINEYTKAYHQLDSINHEISFLQGQDFSISFYNGEDGYTYTYAERQKIGFKPNKKYNNVKHGD